jgi:hypothetical protein
MALTILMAGNLLVGITILMATGSMRAISRISNLLLRRNITIHPEDPTNTSCKHMSDFLAMMFTLS